MPETTLRVELLTHTPEPVALIYAAFRQCYHAGFVADMWPRLLAGEIDPQTMQSRLCPGLFITGEMLDITGLLGGYNLHWAWASGMAAGKALPFVAAQCNS